MSPAKLRVMEKWNLLFGAVFTLVAALAFPSSVALGVALGATLCAVNFWAIRRIWESLLSGSTAEKQRMQVLFLLKTMALIAAVFVVVRYFPIHPVAFAIGLSVFLLSIAVESVRFALGGHAVSKS
jgi:hypothetical protein